MSIHNTVWDVEDQKQYLDEFFHLYNSRPIQDNSGGMKSPHMFHAWYIIKKKQPKFLIESGVWKGQGTWFFEQASPSTKIISIDPNPQFREYTSKNAHYITEDFTRVDWNQSIDTQNTLVFFDDHQYCIPRLKHCVAHNLKELLYEDNYPYNQGDCCSPKKILSQKPFVIDSAGKKTWYEHQSKDYEYLLSVMDSYQEMPPIFKNLFTRWGDKWNHEYPTPEPMLDSSMGYRYPIFFDEKLDYTWMCYIKLK